MTGEPSAASRLWNLVCLSPVLNAPLRRLRVDRRSVTIGPEGARATHLARAIQIAPHLTRMELNQLTDEELDTTPAWLLHRPLRHPKVPRRVFANRPRDTSRIGDKRYIDSGSASVRVDDRLARPRLAFRLGDGGRPLASIDTPAWDGGSGRCAIDQGGWARCLRAVELLLSNQVPQDEQFEARIDRRSIGKRRGATELKLSSCRSRQCVCRASYAWAKKTAALRSSSAMIVASIMTLPLIVWGEGRSQMFRPGFVRW
ncbi:hypothetical protein ABIB82_007310 [Bradyrhizobium sp. i1.8.4]